ncbi:MAG: deoxyribose-phosphate aldolase [Candidatus Caenarcaniphilales bacterium]|nr:deoxyribose-phosphate aldolase [Candidatus Caenarcaniphilales bacterium]
MNEFNHKALSNLAGHFLPLSHYLDHTLLNPLATENDILGLCEEAAEYAMRAVCINPFWTRLAARVLHDTGIEIATVVDFPLGAASTKQRHNQVEEAILEGTTEIDLVAPLHLIQSENWQAFFEDIATLQKFAGTRARLKVILEIGIFEKDKVFKAAHICGQIGVLMVKTSTGMLGARQTEITDLKDLVKALEDHPLTGIKVSGGIRTAAQAWELIQAGAERIGTSKAVALLTE